MFRRLLMGALLAGVGAIVWQTWPDVARYLKIKAM